MLHRLSISIRIKVAISKTKAVSRYTPLKGLPYDALPRPVQPMNIGSLKSKNRLLMSAMSINFGVDDKGHVTEQLILDTWLHGPKAVWV